MSLEDTKIWFEENDNKLIRFPPFDSLPAFLSRANLAPRFIHIEVWTFSCSINPWPSKVRRLDFLPKWLEKLKKIRRRIRVG